MYDYTYLFTVTLLHVSATKWSSSGSTDAFREQGQQNAYLEVNIRLKGSVFVLRDSINVTNKMLIFASEHVLC